MEKEGIKLMMVNKASDGAIRCGIVSKWFKRISCIPSKEMIMPEIEKLKPDVVVIDLNLYDRIGGIDTLNMIRERLDVNAWFE